MPALRNWLLAALLAATIPFPALGQTVDLFLDITNGGLDEDPNTWTLWARTPQSASNDGIAAYNIPILNATSLEPLTIATALDGVPVSGFTLNDTTNNVLFAGQNSTNRESLLYGVGNPSFTVPSAPAGLTNLNMPPVGDPFGPIAIARGTGVDTLIGNAMSTSGRATRPPTTASRPRADVDIFLGSPCYTPTPPGNVNLIVDFASDGNRDTWSLYAVTDGNDDGIAGYNIAIENATEVEHLVIGQGISESILKGFSISSDRNDVLFGGQNSTNPDSLLYGIGNPGFAVPPPPDGLENFNMPPVGTEFGPVLIGQGTGRFMTIGAATNINVWVEGQAALNGVDAAAAGSISVTYLNVPIPEPTAFILSLSVIGGCMARRRRFNYR